MKNEVLIVSTKETFSVHGLETKLNESGFPAFYVPMKVEDLSDKEDEAELIVFYMEGNTTIDPKFLVYLKDLCTEKEKDLFLIGRREEYEEVLKIVPEKCISSWFERPFDINKFVDAVKDQFNTMLIKAAKKTVLICDDDVAYMQMIREWLKDKYQVVMVDSGLKAIQWLTNNTADLVLLDYEMPVTNGPQILEMLKSDATSGEIPVMFLTGQQSKNSVLTAMKLKPIDYLLKSITRSELNQKLEVYFASKKAEG